MAGGDRCDACPDSHALQVLDEEVRQGADDAPGF